MFVTFGHFHPGLVFAGKAGAYPSEGTFATPLSIVCNYYIVINTLAYDSTVIITAS